MPTEEMIVSEAKKHAVIKAVFMAWPHVYFVSDGHGDDVYKAVFAVERAVYQPDFKAEE
jgi:hypothetical protein